MADESIAARAAILERIRKTNADVDPSSRNPEYESITRSYQKTAEMDRATILETFSERLREYEACVHYATPENIAQAIQTALTANGQRSAVIANSFPREWLPEGFVWTSEADTDTEALNTSDGAIVACEVAIAHTGTIVIRDSRRLTLLPDRLLCVVRNDQVVETVPEAFARLQPFAADALTFISGPSATADIEMTRIHGVHGPRFLDVVIVSA